MNEFEAYTYYQSLKLHFTNDKYNAPKYNFKTSANPKSFYKRRDKYFFAKLARKFSKSQDLINFYTAYFIKDCTYVAEMLNDDNTFLKWQKINQSLTKCFRDDISKLSIYEFNDLLVSEGDHPLIIKLFLQGEILLETVVIIDRLTGFTNQADQVIKETILWPDLSRKIKKYGFLLQFDQQKMKKIILETFC